MAEHPPDSFSAVLQRAGLGDRRAAEDLLPMVYQELRALARSRLAREGREQSLGATGLVHEAYLRLVQGGDPGWDHRGHFFAAAAEAMRRILVERARHRARRRHGGELRQTTLGDQENVDQPEPEVILAVHRALDALEAQDVDMALLVKLRYFAGMSVDEAAEALGWSARTAMRRWTAARVWLLRELEGE